MKIQQTNKIYSDLISCTILDASNEFWEDFIGFRGTSGRVYMSREEALKLAKKYPLIKAWAESNKI